jgi:hypothetical protein
MTARDPVADSTGAADEPDAEREARRQARRDRRADATQQPGVMIPARRKRLPLEAPL